MCKGDSQQQVKTVQCKKKPETKKRANNETAKSEKAHESTLYMKRQEKSRKETTS